MTTKYRLAWYENGALCHHSFQTERKSIITGAVARLNEKFPDMGYFAEEVRSEETTAPSAPVESIQEWPTD